MGTFKLKMNGVDGANLTQRKRISAFIPDEVFNVREMNANAERHLARKETLQNKIPFQVKWEWLVARLVLNIRVREEKRFPDIN